MRKISLIILTVVGLTLVSGCDFFRILAGRATSKDIEAKRQFIEQEENLHLQRLEKVKSIQKEIADSLTALDSVRKSVSAKTAVKTVSLNPDVKVTARYHIILGSFSSAENAEKLKSKVEKAGYTAALLNYKSGFTAVGACPTNDLQLVYETYEKIVKEPFCPSDAWILESKGDQ